MTKPIRRFNTWKSQEVLGKILSSASKPVSVEEISRKTGVGLPTVRKYTRHLRNSEQMHVGGWDGQMQLLLSGPGADVPRPEVIRRDEAYKKDSGPATDIELDSTPDWEPLRKCPHPVAIRRDVAAVAIFGEYQGARA